MNRTMVHLEVQSLRFITITYLIVLMRNNGQGEQTATDEVVEFER